MSKEIKLVMYHYVRDLKNSAYPHIKGLEQSVFEKQMAYMKEHYTFLSMEDLVDKALNQNFVPVVDDQENFIGIITRKDIIRYFYDQLQKSGNGDREETEA